MRVVPATLGLLVASMFAGGEAHAQNALVISELAPWGFTALEDELQAQGIPFDVVGQAGLGVVDPYLYTMVFVAECQADSLYTTWNQNLWRFDPWVSDGGFLAIHGCVYSCGSSTGQVFPWPPGAQPSYTSDFPSQGYVQDPTHDSMVGLPGTVTGTSLAHTGFTNTGDPADTRLITKNAGGGGNVYYFERLYGNGTILVGGLTYSFGYGNGQHAGRVLANEVTWGETFDLCGADDDDLDGVGNDCDACPGFDDNLDADGDLIPDDCDDCPNANPNDVDADGICDDIDDSDSDGIVDVLDNCAQVANPDQAESDADGTGDACDNCPGVVNEDQLDADYDGVGDACDICDGGDDKIDTDEDGLPDACDICPLDADPLQKDSDLDGWGDACDCDSNNVWVSPGVEEICDGIDNDCDGTIDGASAVDAVDYYLDADGDGQGDADGATVRDCTRPDGYADNTLDCDDDNVYVRVGATEVCDGLDNDCDGEGDPETCVTEEEEEPVTEEPTGGCSTAGAGGLAGGWLVLGLAGLLTRRRR